MQLPHRRQSEARPNASEPLHSFQSPWYATLQEAGELFCSFHWYSVKTEAESVLVCSFLLFPPYHYIVTLWFNCMAPCSEAPVYLEQNSNNPGNTGLQNKRTAISLTDQHLCTSSIQQKHHELHRAFLPNKRSSLGSLTEIWEPQWL